MTDEAIAAEQHTLNVARLPRAIDAAKRLRYRAMDTLGKMKDVGSEELIERARQELNDSHLVYHSLRSFQDEEARQDRYRLASGDASRAPRAPGGEDVPPGGVQPDPRSDEDG